MPRNPSWLHHKLLTIASYYDSGQPCVVDLADSHVRTEPLEEHGFQNSLWLVIFLQRIIKKNILKEG